jgi:hypothetical protein
VTALEQIAVPPQDRVRLHQQQQASQFVRRQAVKEAGEYGTVGGGKGGLADLALQNQQLMTEREDLDVLLESAHRQQAQDRQDVGRSEVGQTQQHDSS